ncbi:MAG: glycoside hydrolase family 57 protein, partial [Terriglobia bacterium]
MPSTKLMILWHMHQPYYKDLVEDRTLMPWVRLHTLKDYYGMVAMLRDFPSVHVTFNLVPSLISQILDYAKDTAREEAYDLAFKPDLSPSEKEKLVKYAFQINHENLLSRYPRFLELFQRSKGSGTEPTVEPISRPQELLDLQVLSQLAWFDEIYLAHDPEIRALAAKQHGYTEEDKVRLRIKEIELFKVTLEEYRAAAERGQIEISTSPFYHPILPLLCDTQAGADSTPGLPLPRRRFRHPEDARGQLREAMALCEKTFGRKPAGLWPSEGSVSMESLRIAAEEGFAWAATDEGVLGRSIHTFFHRNPDGTVQDGSRLYVPYRLAAGDRSIALFFRDHPISDLVAFVYSRMDPEAAARDLLSRIRAAARSSARQSPVVSVILDGENAWEYYPGNGREFLKRFYSLLASEPDIQTLTPSEILGATETEPLPNLTPGSWIHANFNVWIGADEDNRAWDLLSAARDFFSENAGKPGIDPKRVELARQELWIAEGSDWCWWYGPEHSTANDEEFDELYRKHLSNVYRLLGGDAPDELV